MGGHLRWCAKSLLWSVPGGALVCMGIVVALWDVRDHIVYPERPPTEAEIAWWSVARPEEISEPPVLVIDLRGPGRTAKGMWSGADPTLPKFDLDAHSHERWVGVPFRAATTTQWVHHRTGAVWSTTHRGWPTHILWPGFLANVLVYALTLTAIAWGFRMLRRSIRSEAGRCPACGVRLVTTDGATGCPACHDAS